MNFSRFLTVQSWWEVPCIAYFCSLFRTAFNLLDFDIEELEEALLTDGTEETASSLLTELIVRLLNGCLGNNDISTFNYQMYLRRLFRQKCQETGRYNPFNTDIDFQFLPLRTKVEILYALCDFRLDAADVFDLFKNLEAESLRVEPLGCDDNDSAYWYFYGTRLYREDIIKKPKGKNKKKKKESKRRGWFYGDDLLDDETQRVWQVVCFTEADWAHLTEKFSKATSKVEKELYRSLSQNFLPEIPKLFQEKERLQRKRLLELAPRRTSNRVLQKVKQKEEDEVKDSPAEDISVEERKETPDVARQNRAERRNLLRTKSSTSDSSDSSESEKEEMPQKISKRSKGQEKRSKNSSATQKGEPPPELPVKTGRKTNNSLASATGQIVIPDTDEPINSTRKKLKTSQIFSQTEEDIQTDMYKVLEQLLGHEDAWPFMDPVEEEYAPNYYAVIRRPMDLRKMEERLDTGYYTDFAMFKADFKLIVNNCRLYNGQDNEYTIMVDNLQAAFDRLTEKYISRYSSSDEEIAVEFQIPTPSRKHKRKASESPPRHKRKKRKSNSEPEPGSSTSDYVREEKEKPEEKEDVDKKKSKEKEFQKSKNENKKDDKEKKKRKGHHRHGKHSKNHKKDEKYRFGHSETKSKHGKKEKHHNKKKDGKKSKKKKNKHLTVEPEPIETLKRSESQESLESSNRSRSASPLPSIHTPSPSPTPSPTLIDPADTYKDKFDMIKERRRHAAKDAWESLFEYKQKAPDKQKQNINIPEKDKHQKLRETIEKLKAKNEKYKNATLFSALFSPSHIGLAKKSDEKPIKSSTSKDIREEQLSDEEKEDDTGISSKIKLTNKKGVKKNTAKNESASEALEQAVKDISKWLDDAPKGSLASSPCDSPAQTISTEEQDNSRLDDEFGLGDKTLLPRKDMGRKRPSSREPKLIKRREIQRTIDRLQPGKSKGNLLTNMTNKNAEKSQEEVAPAGPTNKTRDLNKSEESSPKLSLGSVLPTVEFTLGNDHNFSNSDDKKTEADNLDAAFVDSKKDDKKEEIAEKKKDEALVTQAGKKDAEVETEPITIMKPCQEKATPNLSAWFKAFGAPKTPSMTTVKKRVEDTPESEEKSAEPALPIDNKTTLASPKVPQKHDSPIEPETPNPDGGDSPLLNASNTPRQRRTSTGSSVSERSSFSQDLDSPRHQMSHTSPLLRSPASPRADDFQKISYPIINGTVRAGFYQDTTSIKSSPEKSCSPREAPLSPYSPYSPHVYASNNVMGSTTPNYFVDHNKSPLPTYTQNPPPFYDSSKAPVVSKANPTHDNYTALGPDMYPQTTYSSVPYSPAHSPYPQPPSVQTQNSQPATSSVVTATTQQTDAKALFPVKKRTYNEPEVHPRNVLETKEPAPVTKGDYQRPSQTLHPATSLSTSSVDDIALALSEKSEMAKLHSLRDKNKMEYPEQHHAEIRETQRLDRSERIEEVKRDTSNANANKMIGLKKDSVDMVNMGYMNTDFDKRIVPDNQTQQINFTNNRDVSKPNMQQKGYDIDAIAINLGLNSQHNMQKNSNKASANTSTTNISIPPAHSHERVPDISANHNIPHAHQYDNMSSGQSISNFSLNDIELANKKLYACNANPSTAAVDYGNWKMTNQIRKSDMMPSDFSHSYNTNNQDKLKMDTNVTNAAAINYNKNLHQQQYSNYNSPRPMLRAHDLQQSLPSELRIPNPRSHHKSDHLVTPSTMAESDMNMVKNIEATSKTQKAEKLPQNHTMVGSMTYKTPYSTHSNLPLDSLRTLQNIPQMLERYTNDERYLSSFAGGTSSLYHDKTYQMAQMFNKNMQPEVHPTSTSSNIYSQSSSVMNKDISIYKNSPMPAPQADTNKTAAKNKRKRVTEAKQQHAVATQTHYATSSGTDVLSSVKSSMMSGSAFNFGTSSNMGLGSGIYGDNSGFSIEDFRNSTNQLMAANYMAAAAAAHQQQQQRSSAAEAGVEKMAKPAHQNSSGAFPFLGAGQVRAGYGFADPSSPLYQQYFQRHQEELLRQTGAQIMGLYPPAYPPGLGTRQPYDSINRHSWL